MTSRMKTVFAVGRVCAVGHALPGQLLPLAARFVPKGRCEICAIAAPDFGSLMAQLQSSAPSVLNVPPQTPKLAPPDRYLPAKCSPNLRGDSGLGFPDTEHL